MARSAHRRTTARPNLAADRAVRAAAQAAPREPRLPPGFLSWALGRALAMALLVGAAWVVYDSASSDRFQVRSVRVQGNVLLSKSDVQDAAEVTGANVFWLDGGQVVQRLLNLAPIQRAEVRVVLPDTVEISIVERKPAAFWVSGDVTYLVDSEGVILKAVDAETLQARACAGQPCDPRLAPLPSVAEIDAQPLVLGARIDASALVISARLATLLPKAGIEPLAFEWNRDSDLEVPTRDGWRARFDDRGNVDEQVAMLRSVRDELARTKTAAQLIDVRFGDRPYFR